MRSRNKSDLDSIISLISGDLCIAQLSVMTTNYGRGKRFILSRRPKMNSVKSLILKVLWTTIQSTMPSMLMASKREYLNYRGWTYSHVGKYYN